MKRSWFRRARDLRVYRTPRAELAAVAAGAKALALEVWPRGAHAGDPDHARLVRLARGFELELVERRITGRGGVALTCIYVVGDPRETWRMPALEALWRVCGTAWSDDAEALESHLLGYTREQTAAWLAACRHRRLGWRGETVYEAGGRYAWCDGAHEPAFGRVSIARTAIDAATCARLFSGHAAVRIAELDPPALEGARLAPWQPWDPLSGTWSGTSPAPAAAPAPRRARTSTRRRAGSRRRR